MNLGNKILELKFEKAVQLLCQYMPAGQDRKKPILMHAMRVGIYLYDHEYSEDSILAGLLHDILEWTEVSQKVVLDLFGQNVFNIIVANTQKRTIESKKEQWQDMVVRCSFFGKDALIVKAADTLDSLKFYQSVGHSDEIQRSMDIGKYILEQLPEGIQDPLFDRLREEITK